MPTPFSCVLIPCQVMIVIIKLCCCSGVAVCKAGRRQEQQPGTAAAAVPPHRGGRLRAAQARERGLQAPPEAHAHARPSQARHHPRDHAAPLVRPAFSVLSFHAVYYLHLRRELCRPGLKNHIPPVGMYAGSILRPWSGAAAHIRCWSHSGREITLEAACERSEQHHLSRLETPAQVFVESGAGHGRAEQQASAEGGAPGAAEGGADRADRPAGHPDGWPACLGHGRLALLGACSGLFLHRASQTAMHRLHRAYSMRQCHVKLGTLPFGSHRWSY